MLAEVRGYGCERYARTPLLIITDEDISITVTAVLGSYAP